MRSHIERLKQEFPELLGKAQISIGSGWENLVRTLCRNLQELPDQIQAVQVKEKFGQLRFYFDVSGSREGAAVMVRDAEGRSKSVCENCGTIAGVRMEASRGWIKSLCDSCRVQEWERSKKRFSTPDNPPQPVIDAKNRLHGNSSS